MAGEGTSEVQRLEARVRRQELGAWIERALLALLVYVSWDRIPSMAVLGGGALVGFAVFFSIVERVRALR